MDNKKYVNGIIERIKKLINEEGVKLKRAPITELFLIETDGFSCSVKPDTIIFQFEGEEQKTIKDPIIATLCDFLDKELSGREENKLEAKQKEDFRRFDELISKKVAAEINR